MDQTFTRIQLCGPLIVEWPGRFGQLALRNPQVQRVFAFLVLHRTRPVTRDELVDAVWGEQPPPASDTALSALVSRLRSTLGDDVVSGRGVPKIRLPAGSVVDAERAATAAHEAHARLSHGEHAPAYFLASEAVSISDRRFLPGHDAEWVDDWRRRLDVVNSEASELLGRASLALGGSELATADRVSARLVRKLPYRESAHALRMEVLAAQGNSAEALLVYEQLRGRLAEDLGASPGRDLRALHERLLRATES